MMTRRTAIAIALLVAATLLAAALLDTLLFAVEPLRVSLGWMLP